MYYIAGYVMYVARKQVQNFTLLVTLWKSRQQQLTRTLLPALGMEEYLLIPKVFNTVYLRSFDNCQNDRNKTIGCYNMEILTVAKKEQSLPTLM